MSQLVLDNLEKQLETAVKANIEVHDKIDAGKITEMKVLMNGFECPEGFQLRFRTYETALVKEGSNWESARVNIDSEFDFETRTRSIKATVNANGGREVDELLAQAKFVQFTSPKLDQFEVAIESVAKYYEEAKNSTGKEVSAIERAIKEVEASMRKLKVDEVKNKMFSSEGFDTVITKTHWGGFGVPRITLKRDWDKEVVNVKLVNETTSGKSVDVIYTCRLYDGTLVTKTEERVRMQNVDAFIKGQLYRIEKVEEGELEQVTLEDMDQKVEA
jgi:hypothetical protein